MLHNSKRYYSDYLWNCVNFTRISGSPLPHYHWHLPHYHWHRGTAYFVENGRYTTFQLRVHWFYRTRRYDTSTVPELP